MDVFLGIMTESMKTETDLTTPGAKESQKQKRVEVNERKEGVKSGLRCRVY